MSNIQSNIKAVFSESLVRANQSAPFFNKADCMRDFANYHKARRAIVSANPTIKHGV